MRLDKLLISQGFGPRKECQFLIQHGAVRIDGEVCQNIKQQVNPKGLEYSVHDVDYLYREHIYLALNKPQGYECSHQPEHHSSVFELLPELLIYRGLQSVGRLDQDTTGLLLFTDDGQWLHGLTHPKKHIAKTYFVTTKDPIDSTQIERLTKGVALRNEVGLYKATDVRQLNEHALQLTIHQGIYHQVKRMIAAVGNAVDTLHRSQIGEWVLPDTLAEGDWQYLEAADLIKLQHQ
ncbi:16S rRNA pseudouridine(516) synthase [Acinetobacter sp. B10A]|uniref:pseudouridine synthase n=1 Tax=Acinetobacter baretiae TaxID=2605383 RepID=UPI001B3C8423|nr:16S rRNA pseudouridine(516) synthase [Acinetobacter baretiae]MBF7684577.1 16S rRNA pseudouridine(516) synthase [Acinetobacter baretiae]